MTAPTVALLEWLTAQCEWMRHRPEVDEWLTDVEACARVVRGLARGPGEQRYLGPCGAPLLEIDPEVAAAQGIHPANAALGLAPCDGNVYGYVGAEQGRCRTCEATVSQDARRAWLDDEVRAHAFRAAHIADAYGVNVNTIRTWATRPRPDTGQPPLASYWRTEAGLVTPWIEAPADATAEERTAIEAARGPRLHYVGDVLDLAAADAARRETERAKREQRAAARAAAATEGDAA